MNIQLRSALRFLAVVTVATLVLPVQAEPKKVLVVTVTTSFRHSSIGTAEKVLAKLGQESGAFTVDYVQQPPNKPNAPRKPQPPKPTNNEEKDKAAKEKYDAELKKFQEDEPRLNAEFKAADAKWQVETKAGMSKLTPENLKNYDAVIFANTTGDLPLPDRDAFIAWVKAGHGFCAMHSGSDTFHGYRPYIEMLGGEFQTHGAQEVVECLVKDTQHPAVKHFGASWDIHGKKEEIYIIKSYDPTKVHELLVLDKHPNTKAPGHYAMSWCKDFGKGKVFYTSLGHNEYVWEMPEYQQHILGGIKWALGLEKGDATPQTK
ncbi:MAG: ThuA domain-containing protein [Verrucomicrobia bacterium]|nr:ThuA domain-containing protein [Verrucomicrobiota bacterium]